MYNKLVKSFVVTVPIMLFLAAFSVFTLLFSGMQHLLLNIHIKPELVDSPLFLLSLLVGLIIATTVAVICADEWFEERN